MLLNLSGSSGILTLSMKSSDIRSKFLHFYGEKGHAIIPSASLVPENDPTTLFTGSGMQPLVPYLLGESHPEGTRLTDSQKSFRADDIVEVGDNRHTTFFEMLGNWSLGDYFKKEQLPWVFEFLTGKLGLDPERIYVTVFDGDESLGIQRDEESIAIWKDLFSTQGITARVGVVGSEKDGYERGMKTDERIFTYDSSKNWWSRSGVPANMPVGELGGPDSEIFYDFGTPHDSTWGEHCHPNCDCGRFLEIGNSVFMEYIKTENGFEQLSQKNVDFGGGLERLAAATNNQPDVFLAVDSLANIIEHLEKASGTDYADNTKSFRTIADHLRGAVFMIADGVLPSNTEQGYFVRRLIRRSVQYADVLGITEGTLADAVAIVADAYADHYPELTTQQDTIVETIAAEEKKFRNTLTKGMREFEKLAEAGSISPEQAFTLFSSYGFPIELTQELAAEKNITIDVDAVTILMQEHQAKSRAGAGQKFKGGLADAGEKTTQLHTTHHLLLKALQIVLGDHVKQRGSNITGERLRIDFSHDTKMTDEQKAEVERIVNEKIAEKIPVIKNVLPKEEAEQLGAEQEFGQKYPDMVNVYSIGELGNAFSMEFCGGPHVENTGDIQGTFRIAKESASSAGIRRIKGVLE